MTEGLMPQKLAKSITLLAFGVLWLGMGGAVRAQIPATPVAIKPEAPAQYTVIRGDTLWGISERFTDSPWRWPELWRFNRDQIRNPHLIYPGDVIVLDRVRGQLSVSRGEAAPQEPPGAAVGAQAAPSAAGEPPPGTAQVPAAGTAPVPVKPPPDIAARGPRGVSRLTPRVRIEPSEGEGIPSIPLAMIAPFLTQPLVDDTDERQAGPTIIAAEEDRVMLSAGTVAYARGLSAFGLGVTELSVYRRGEPLIDPETDKPLGYEAIYLGSAAVTRPGEPAAIRIETTKQEIVRGDRLVPSEPARPLNFMPRAPTTAVKGRIMSIYGGLSKVGEASRYSIVTLNRGRAEGLEVGNVLALYRHGVTVTDASRREQITVPDERYGLVFVFRVFERVSYALVMNATRPVRTRDVVQNP